MSVVDVEQRWPRNGRLIGHVANETITRKLLHVRWSQTLPLWSHLSYSPRLHLGSPEADWRVISKIGRSGLPKIPCLVSMKKSVLLYNAWETSSPNHTPMMLNVTSLQCFTFTTKAYPNTSRVAVKNIYQNCTCCIFVDCVWVLIREWKRYKIWKQVTEGFVVI